MLTHETKINKAKFSLFGNNNYHENTPLPRKTLSFEELMEEKLLLYNNPTKNQLSNNYQSPFSNNNSQTSNLTEVEPYSNTSFSEETSNTNYNYHLENEFKEHFNKEEHETESSLGSKEKDDENFPFRSDICKKKNESSRLYYDLNENNYQNTTSLEKVLVPNYDDCGYTVDNETNVSVDYAEDQNLHHLEYIEKLKFEQEQKWIESNKLELSALLEFERMEKLIKALEDEELHINNHSCESVEINESIDELSSRAYFSDDHNIKDSKIVKTITEKGVDSLQYSNKYLEDSINFSEISDIASEYKYDLEDDHNDTLGHTDTNDFKENQTTPNKLTTDYIENNFFTNSEFLKENIVSHEQEELGLEDNEADKSITPRQSKLVQKIFKNKNTFNNETPIKSPIPNNTAKLKKDEDFENDFKNEIISLKKLLYEKDKHILELEKKNSNEKVLEKRKLIKEKEDFEKFRHDEIEKIENFREVELKKIKNAKIILEKQKKANLILPTKKENLTIQSLKEELSSQEKKFKLKESKYLLELDRTKKNLENTKNLIQELKEESKVLESSRLNLIEENRILIFKLRNFEVENKNLKLLQEKNQSIASFKGEDGLSDSSSDLFASDNEYQDERLHEEIDIKARNKNHSKEFQDEQHNNNISNDNNFNKIANQHNENQIQLQNKWNNNFKYSNATFDHEQNSTYMEKPNVPNLYQCKVNQIENDESCLNDLPSCKRRYSKNVIENFQRSKQILDELAAKIGLPENYLKEKHYSDGKLERTYFNGVSLSWYKNGTTKESRPNGFSCIRFLNGDYKTEELDGSSKYFFAKSKTLQITFVNGTKIFQFFNGQIEKMFKDGKLEIIFPDLTFKTVLPNNSYKIVYPDGTIEKSKNFLED
ncbi:hypothetical protein HDU92_008137, partial [Lobulomyces angularis]